MGLDSQPLSSTVYLGAFTGSTGTELPCFAAEVACRIVGVEVTDITGVTAHADNYGTGLITNKGTTGSGTTAVATRATDTVTTDIIASFKPWPLVMAADSGTNRRVAAGESLAFKWSEAGTGQDLGGAAVTVYYAIGWP